MASDVGSLVIAESLLHCLSSLDLVTDQDLDVMIDFMAEMVLNIQAERFDQSRDPRWNESYDSLAYIFVEGTRQRVTVENLRLFLIDHGISDTKITIILNKFQIYEPQISKKLLNIGISFPTIVDLKWRLDYTLKSRKGGRMNAALYYLTVVVIEKGAEKNIEMIATFEDVKHLLRKMKEALREVDRVITTLDKDPAPTTATHRNKDF